jgi:hypothetical protein
VAKRRVHRIPHTEVRAVLVRRGISSVNRAIEWGESKSLIIDREGLRVYPLISAKSIEGILRGKRTLGVEFDRVDQILCALEAPEVWYLELSEWYYPPGVAPEEEYETFLRQRPAFERARQMFEGQDAALTFS